MADFTPRLTMKNNNLISKHVENFYNQASEEDRLENGMGTFEFERVKSLIEKYISGANATIIDVGGGTGKYAEWLAKKNHDVHLVEPVLKHIKLAQKRANKLKNKFSVIQGESQNLNFPDGFADLVILHGPLYHLQDQEDRERTIREAKRVLKKDGIVLGFAINHSASTVVGLFNGMIHNEAYFNMCKTELSEGVHNPPKDFPWLLAEAFYHKPDQLKHEFLTQKLTFLNLHAVEGMAWLDANFFTSLADEKKKKTLIELIELTENDNHLLAFSPHMMIAAKK